MASKSNKYLQNEYICQMLEYLNVLEYLQCQHVKILLNEYPNIFLVLKSNKYLVSEYI